MEDVLSLLEHVVTWRWRLGYLCRASLLGQSITRSDMCSRD